MKGQIATKTFLHRMIFDELERFLNPIHMPFVENLVSVPLELKSISASFNKSIFFLSSEVGSQWQQAEQGVPDIPLSGSAFQDLLEDP